MPPKKKSIERPAPADTGAVTTWIRSHLTAAARSPKPLVGPLPADGNRVDHTPHTPIGSLLS